MTLFVLFFFKQKTAYEMRISDWSSDVCSSDLLHAQIMRHSMVYARKLIKMAKIRSRTHGSCRRPGLSWTQRSISREATMAVFEHHADLPLRPDYTLDQPRHLYSAEDHAVWRDLFRRQAAILSGRACDEFLAGLDGLGVAADYRLEDPTSE